MTPTAGATALPAGTRIALASGKQQPIEKLAPGAILAGDAVVTAVDRLPGGSVTGAVLLAPGAIAPASPAAPLILSAQQWIVFADRLAPAGALANGITIQRLAAIPGDWYALTADRPSTVTAEGVSLPLPGPRGSLRQGPAARLRPLAAGPELEALRARLRPPPPPPLRLMLGTRELPAVLTENGLEATLPPADGAPMTVLRLVSPPGRPRDTADLRRFGVAIRRIELNGTALALDDPGFGAGFYPVEHHDNATWRWTNGDATLALPPAEAPRALAIHIAPWHTQLEPA